MSEPEFHPSPKLKFSILYPFFIAVQSKLTVDYCHPLASEVGEKLKKASKVDSSLAEPGILKTRTEN
jgi:hypothetical protein